MIYVILQEVSMGEIISIFFPWWGASKTRRHRFVKGRNFKVNLRGKFYLTQKVVDLEQAQRGHSGPKGLLCAYTMVDYKYYVLCIEILVWYDFLVVKIIIHAILSSTQTEVHLILPVLHLQLREGSLHFLPDCTNYDNVYIFKGIVQRLITSSPHAQTMTFWMSLMSNLGLCLYNSPHYDI